VEKGRNKLGARERVLADLWNKRQHPSRGQEELAPKGAAIRKVKVQSQSEGVIGRRISNRHESLLAKRSL